MTCRTTTLTKNVPLLLKKRKTTFGRINEKSNRKSKWAASSKVSSIAKALHKVRNVVVAASCISPYRAARAARWLWASLRQETDRRPAAADSLKYGRDRNTTATTPTEPDQREVAGSQRQPSTALPHRANCLQVGGFPKLLPAKKHRLWRGCIFGYFLNGLLPLRNIWRYVCGYFSCIVGDFSSRKSGNLADGRHCGVPVMRGRPAVAHVC